MTWYQWLSAGYVNSIEQIGSAAVVHKAIDITWCGLTALLSCGARKISGSSGGCPTLTSTRPWISGWFMASLVWLPLLVGSSSSLSCSTSSVGSTTTSLSSSELDSSMTSAEKVQAHINDLVQDCSNPSALAMELLQSCTKPSIYIFMCVWCWTS